MNLILKGLGYIICSIVFILFLNEGIHLYNNAKEYVVSNHTNVMNYLIILPVFSIFAGMFIAIPTFIERYRSPGKWRYNWIRLLFIGLPLFIVTFSSILYFSPITDYIGLLLRPIASLGVTVQVVTGVLLGYTSLDSLHRDKESN